MDHVLIAEDDPGLAAMLVKGLGRHGFDTTVVDTAEDAIDAARHGRYAVLILDLNHTGTGKRAILRSLREQGCLVPVLVLNGRDGPRDRATALDAGAAGLPAHALPVRRPRPRDPPPHHNRPRPRPAGGSGGPHFAIRSAPDAG